jgi:hypothetical protein
MRGSVRNPRGSLATGWFVIFIVASSCAPQSPSGNAQVFSGSTPASTPMPLVSGGTLISTPNSCVDRTIRTVTFTKKSASTRLRITYKDTAAAIANNGGALFVVGRIDGVAVTKPTGARMQFAVGPAGTNVYSYYGSFTLVAYADDVAQGSHTLAFVYETKSGALETTFSCFIAGEPFLIEIEETP